MNKTTGNADVRFGTRIGQFLSDVVYTVFRGSLKVVFRIFFKVKIQGMENCPPHGPLLVACNHLSNFDPPFVGSCLPWQMNWLAKVELFELLGGLMNPFFYMLHCVPVDREKADLAAIKSVVRLLKTSRPVMVFVEGGIRTDETSLLGSNPQLKGGGAMMATLSGAPILPVLINGTLGAESGKSWLKIRSRTLEVVIGPVFKPSSRDRDMVTGEILQNLLALKTKLEQKTMC